MAGSGLYCAVGLMSGTSADGVDAAILWTDGQDQIRSGPSITLPYDDRFRARLKSLFGQTEPSADSSMLERELTERHAAAVRDVLGRANLTSEDIALIGFHGQTLHHAPDRGRTWQIGDGSLLAKLTGIPVVNDFRSADLRAGGQGAPLVPIYHAALTGRQAKPVAVINIGGIANVTWIGPGAEDLLAFDTGPGNALIDDWMLRHTGQPMDHDGGHARAGAVHPDLVAHWLKDPFFGRLPPKSLDRQAFSTVLAENLTLRDGAATLTYFTAASIAKAQAFFPQPVKEWIICGGGARNPTLLNMLADCLEQPIVAAEVHGWDSDAIEAQAFAYLAVRHVRNLPLSFPGTTGVAKPTTGGVFHHP